jgi:hypothetical protein
VVSLKKVVNMHLQHDTSADATTMLVSADGMLVRLLLLICFLFWDVVREGVMRLHAKKRSRSSRGQCSVSMRDGHDGRISTVEFLSSWFLELWQWVFGAVKSRYL